ncbi:hypothetical protein HanXRQr2_Chr11g0515521 [Helianthus annuus]|uniref:Uncharacterized protein n=1 Tax=Helianthus annuus TaxID=4232 RepID=A0A251TF55_HELAN|nr:hypothetical protein HanXRQr2_Chr11g0515521 [Helianthus annuus]
MNGCIGADATTTFRVHVRISSPGFGAFLAYLCYERVVVVLMLMASILSTLANLL